MWMSTEEFERRCQEMRAKFAAVSRREAQLRKLEREEREGKVRWKDPKRQRSLWSIRRYGIHKEPGPPTAKPPTESERRAILSKYSLEELRLKETELLTEIFNMERFIPILKSSLRNIRSEIKIREGRQQHPRWKSPEGIEYPKECPRCHHDKIVRAGFVRSSQNQMFRCKACNSTFVNPEKKTVKPITDFNLVCHRCWGKNTENRGPGKKEKGGRQGFCFTCNKGFTQGGKHHLEKNYSTLEQRVKQLGLSKDVELEVLQDAALRVLKGEGYVHNIPLQKSAAFREVYGEFGQMGSDHRVFKLHNDQPFED